MARGAFWRRRGFGKRIEGDEDVEDQINRIATYLNSPPTNWEEVYCRLKLTAFGNDFSPEKFLRTPTQTLRSLMLLAENESQRHTNHLSVSASYVTSYLLQIAHGFSGSKKAPPKTTAKDFLPFPEWEPLEGTENRTDRPSELTRSILKTLLIKRKLPIHVYIALDGKAKEQT